MTTETQKKLPIWIIIVSGLFTLMEIGVSLSMFFSPQIMDDKIDLNAKGVDFLMYMWATRQLALGFIFAFATIKKSRPMLTLAYIFFLAMNIGDILIGILKHDNSLIGGASVMCIISTTLIYFINKDTK